MRDTRPATQRARPARQEPGAALDRWRIEEVDDGRSLLLRAETKLPGIVWLELRAEPAGEHSRYVQRVTFQPRGLPGRAYWYAQEFVFSVLARTIAGTARRVPLARKRPRLPGHHLPRTPTCQGGGEVLVRCQPASLLGLTMVSPLKHEALDAMLPTWRQKP